tara:strand:+ start:6612 stop:7493 length:882 start_codon:yes stop_codon:yes gene_type:complete
MRTKSDDIAVFLAVADVGSFSEAARLLDIEVARCSRAVKRLEQQLGQTLLTRTTRRVELTSEGQAYLEAVRPGIEQLEVAEQKLIEADGKPKGRLRVDAATPFHLHQITPHVAEFRRLYPGIMLELSASEGFIDLMERRVDLAIRIGALADSSMHASYLGRSQLHIVASPEYVHAFGQPEYAADLEQHTKIGFMQSDTLNVWPVDEGRFWQPDIAVSSGEVMRQLALQGNGLACLSNFMVADDLKAGRLVKLLSDHHITDNPRERVNAVYYRNTALSSRISAFLTFFMPRFRL